MADRKDHETEDHGIDAHWLHDFCEEDELMKDRKEIRASERFGRTSEIAPESVLVMFWVFLIIFSLALMFFLLRGIE